MIELTSEFEQVIENINNKQTPIFVTGGAGVGKSTLISYIQKNFRNVVSVAPTGIAALNIKGSTINSTFRIPPKYITIIDKKSLLKNQVIAVADIVIIDEISMVNANMLDAIDYVMRKSKGNNLPFGGITLVMFGDLYQLPPVVTDETKKYFDKEYDTPYFFSANCLKKTKLKTIKLTKVFRQNDEQFINALNNIREGNDIQGAIDYINLNAHLTENDKNSIVVTTTNRKCNEINNLNLRKIKEDEHTFMGVLNGKFNIKSLPVDSIIDLKVGCRVMVAKNIANAVNGTIGTVIDIIDNSLKIDTDDGGIITVNNAVWENVAYRVSKNSREVEQIVLGSYTQIPVKLAWCITSHKAQGQTMDHIHVDMDSGAFASGQLYVTLSRARSVQGITLSRPIYTSDVIVDCDVKQFYEHCE